MFLETKAQRQQRRVTQIRTQRRRLDDNVELVTESRTFGLRPPSTGLFSTKPEPRRGTQPNGRIKRYVDLDWLDADVSIQRAIALDPRNPDNCSHKPAWTNVAA
jgi:hypothetical protein